MATATNKRKKPYKNETRLTNSRTSLSQALLPSNITDGFALTQISHFPHLEKVEIESHVIPAKVEINEVGHGPDLRRHGATQKVGFNFQMCQL